MPTYTITELAREFDITPRAISRAVIDALRFNLPIINSCRE